MAVVRATEVYGVDFRVTKHQGDTGWTMATDERQLVLLQEIRDELKQLNTLLHCANTLKIPRELSGLRRDVKALTRVVEARTTSRVRRRVRTVPATGGGE